MNSRSLCMSLLALAFAVGMPACDSKSEAPDKREDEGGDEKASKKKEAAEPEADEEEEEARLSDDGTKPTPTPVTPGTGTPATKTGDFKTADQFNKGDGTAATTTGDETKKADDGAGATPIGATPINSDKRGAGSNTGGQCPCLRGLVCCDGVCKKSCS